MFNCAGGVAVLYLSCAALGTGIIHLYARDLMRTASVISRPAAVLPPGALLCPYRAVKV